MNKHINQTLFRILLSVFTMCCFGFAQAQNTATDARDVLVLEAAQAYSKKNAARVDEILTQVTGHPMEPWVHYWSMRLRIEKATPKEMRTFFARWKGTYVEDRLRNDWLLILGRKGQLDIFAQEYPAFVMRDDSQVLCYALLIDHRNGHDAASKAKEEFIKIRPSHVKEDGCNTLAGALYQAKKMSAQDVWIKARRLVELNRVSATQSAVAIVLDSAGTSIQALMNKPEKWLEEQKKTHKTADSASALTAAQKELITLALIRWAAKEPDAAIAHMNNVWKKDLSADQTGWVYGVAGRVMALRLDAKALDHYKHTTHAKGLSDETRVWYARAQLRAAAANQASKQGWQQLLHVISLLPPELSAEPAWVYWKAIATKLAADGATAHAAREQANALLESIAGFDGFYPQLATEALGRQIKLPSSHPEAPTKQEIDAAASTPGLMRALYAIRMGLRNEGVREWNWNLRGRNERQLQAAAQLACDAQVWDRCINTSERAKNLFNIGQRYPLPYRELALPRALEVGLDPAFVFGLMRQESRFVHDIKSSAGAQGLMQLMPKTAKWTAKKMGMNDFDSSMVTDPKTNIALGTAYLNMSMEEFGHSQALASAGYNAGPSRPRRWRNGPLLEGAVWAENVPFDETRNYVQTVLSASVVYHMILTGQPESLQSRLGKIGPQDPKSVSKNPDLP